jgi:hypothetical protein
MRAPLLAVAAVLVLALVLACGGSSDEETVTYRNATAGVVRVAVDGVEIASIEAGSTHESKVSEGLMPDHIEAFDTSGNPVFDETLTWEQFEERDWLVVID